MTLIHDQELARVALWYAQRANRIANGIRLNEAMAGSEAARLALQANYETLLLAAAERQLPPTEDPPGRQAP